MLQLAAIAIASLTCVLACSGEVDAPAPQEAGGATGASASGGASAGRGASVAAEGGAVTALAGMSSVGSAGGDSAVGGAGVTMGGAPPVTGGGHAGAGGGSPVGVQIYAMRCAKCHGADGRGGNYAPEIVHPVRSYATWVVRHGRPYSKMPAFAEAGLSDAQLGAIFDYLDEPAQRTTGVALFADYCGNCHDGSDPSPKEMTKSLPDMLARVRSGSNPEDVQDRSRSMPSFPEARVSDAQIELIFSYLRAL